jgi:hypothetical protein
MRGTLQDRHTATPLMRLTACLDVNYWMFLLVYDSCDIVLQSL